MDHEPILREELIKNGAIQGREALSWLENHGSWVSRGSMHRLDHLEPRQALSRDQVSGEMVPDSEPGVSATDSLDIAIFRSLISRHRDATAGKPHLSSFGKTGDEVMYSTTEDALERARSHSTVGYVHVFPRSDFVSYNDFEFRVNHSVEPVYVVAVKGKDLPEGIDVVEVP